MSLEFKQLRTLEGWIELVKLLKPKFYDKITWTLVVAGLAILSTPFLQNLVTAFIEIELNIKVTDDNDPAVGLTLIFLALSYNTICLKIGVNEREQQERVAKQSSIHDKTLFQKIDDMLNEKTFKNITNSISSNLFIEPWQNDLIYKFLHECDQTSAKMLDPALESARIQLVNAIEEFRAFLAIHFFYKMERKSSRNSISNYEPDKNKYLYPDLNPEITCDFSEDQVYLTRADELSTLADDTEKAYDAFRMQIKKKLHI